MDGFFNIKNEEQFQRYALEVFQWQAQSNSIYKRYLDLIDCRPEEVNDIRSIPFLPIELFKKHQILSGNDRIDLEFLSSGTTGGNPSRHFIHKKELYHKSLTKCFNQFFGDPKDFCFLALLPSYLERTGSSLVYMVNHLMQLSGHPINGFFINDQAELKKRLDRLEGKKQKTILIGISFALLDFAKLYPGPLNHTLVMETGGMKGHREEMVREEFHSILMNAFGLSRIYSEYGMTELLSQAYSESNGRFSTPPWMKVLIRDLYNPFHLNTPGNRGGINIIDLANYYSCAFIQTQDLGISHKDGTFEVLGRFDNSELRGCNLLMN